MAEALIYRFDGVTSDDYDAVNKLLEIDMTSNDDLPDGLLVHLAGTADDGAFVVAEVWASREAQEAFMANRLGAALAQSGVPAPTSVAWVSTHAFQTKD